MIIKASKAKLKRDDFSNATNVCDICQTDIPLSVKNHILECSGTGTPLAPALKRIKLSQFDTKDRPMVLKFNKLGIKLHKINSANQDYHRGIAPVRRELKRRKIFSRVKK